MADLCPTEYYPAFVTSERVDGPRIPINGERIVVVLGQDKDTGLPLEFSICLRRNEDDSLSVYAIREPFAQQPIDHLPDLVVEEAGAVNVRSIRIRMKRLFFKKP